MEQTLLIIVGAPLIASIVAGLLGRQVAVRARDRVRVVKMDAEAKQ